MAETSSMLAPGTALPTVRLVDARDGALVDVSLLAKGKKGTAVFFLCNHCPFVVHVRQELVRAAHDAQERGLAVVAINSNDEQTYPQDAPPAMARLAKEEGWRFPFLFDASQDVARAFHAQATPECYLFDAEGKLAYHGRFDESTPSNGKPVTGRDFREAVLAVAQGRAPSPDQKASVGCGIKWRRR